MSPSPERTVIFLHLMKTGGRTLTRILKQNYSQDARFHCGQRSGQALTNLAEMPEEKRRSLRFIYGHMQFGVHRFLPQPCTYITLLRHPVERVLSHYYYALHYPKHFTHQLVTEQNMSLSEYVEHGILDLNNGQVRAIAGQVSQRFQFGEQHEDLLHEAQANLETSFSLVGITEHFDESLLLLKHQLNLTHFLYTRANVNASRQAHKPVTDDDIECIKHYNALDLQLYDAAQQQLQHDIQGAGALFQSELAFLQEMNAQYEKAQSNLDEVNHGLSTLRGKLKRVRRRRSQVKNALKRKEAELSELMNRRGTKLRQKWITLKQKLHFSVNQ